MSASPQQAILEWGVDIPTRDVASFRAALEGNDVVFSEGSHTIYIPPQERLEELIPQVVGSYPCGTGFKVLKDFRPPDAASYVVGARNTAVRRAIIGGPSSLAVAAHRLHTLRLGPRVWDTCAWLGNEKTLTVFCVDHVTGEAPDHDTCEAFMAELSQHVEAGRVNIAFPSWRSKLDFECPNCGGNLLTQDGRPSYIDFQNFVVRQSEWVESLVHAVKDACHFGDGRPFRGASYLYQRIPGIRSPGKRNSLRRWDVIRRGLAASGISVRGRVVLDIGCNSGMMLNAALADGAYWGVGWDRPRVAQVARELLLAVGASRTSVVEANLDEDYSLTADLGGHLRNRLEGSVVLYLAMRHHIGFAKELTELPWVALVYEGAQGERTAELAELLRPLLETGARITTAVTYRDGDSGARPLAVLLRD